MKKVFLLFFAEHVIGIFSMTRQNGKAKSHFLLVSLQFPLILIGSVSKYILLLLLASIAFPAAWFNGQEPTGEAKGNLQPKLSSDQAIVLDEATGQLVAKGKARLEYGALLLLADEIRYERAKGLAFAKGKVVLTFEEIRILASELEYSLSENRFAAKNTRFGRYPVAGESKSLEGSLDGLAIANDASIHLLGPDNLAPNLKADTLAFDGKEGIFRAEGLRLRIGQASLVPLPKIETRRRESPLEASLSAGHDDQLGASVEIHSLFDVRPGLRIGGSLEGYSKRGMLVGPEAIYEMVEESYKGSFASGFIKDQSPSGLDVQGKPLPDSRGFLDWSHLQQINDRFSFAAQVQWRRDSEVFRDFRQEAFNENQWNDTFAELTYYGDNSIASVFGRMQPYDFSDQIERKPEIGLHLLPTEILETGIYHSLSLGLVDLKEAKSDASTETQSKRADVVYHLTRHFPVAKWLSVTPSATYRMARYWDALGADDTLTRHFGEFGLDARIPFHATFDVQNELWEIDGLRHRGSFLFQYRYLEDSSDADRARVPLLDRRYFDPNLDPLDLSEIRYLDDLTEGTRLRVGIENRFQTRAKDYGSRDLAAIRIYQDILIDPPANEGKMDSFFGEMALHPVHWLSLGVQAKIDVDNGDLQQVALESRLMDADLAELSLAILRLENRSNQYRVLGFRKIDEKREIQSGLQFDAETGNLTRATIGVYSRISDSWDLAYLLAHRKGTAREDDLSFRLGFRMLKF